MLVIKHSICPSCSVGCGLNLINNENKIVGTYPYKKHPINEGKNCLNGRNSYKLVDENRINTPLIKNQGKFSESEWDEVLKNISEIFQKYSSDEIGILLSGNINNEDLEAIGNLEENKKIKNIGFFNNNFPKFSEEEIASYDDVNTAKFILVIGDVLKDNPLIGRRIIIAKDNDAEITSVDTLDKTTTSLNSNNYLKANSISEFIDKFDKDIENKLDENSVIIFNKLDSEEDFDKLVEISKTKNSKILPVLNQCNSYGVMDKIQTLNKEKTIDLINKSKVLLLINTDLYSFLDKNELEEANLSKIDSIISITTNSNQTSELSNIVLPCACWAETSGSFTNTIGLVQNYDKVKECPEAILSVKEIINKIF